ncbi:hypothetical protein O181_090922 [Austropuccinia psidii MF-1]|uniref:Uncharacterized protein n=1 Tax=Austropuccinia psidii MF-1 TaxID=1389203 RepID=A0A9Q3IWH9_9BASI|nr:hypothetical protein [Austropuccinia psidii MF-1]
MGPLAPFGLNPMRPKGANHQPPSHKWAHLSQFWPPISIFPKNGQKDPRTKIGKEPHFGHLSTSGLPKLPQATISGPARFPPQFRGRTLLHQRIQEWCIYGIIYHYAPNFLSTPIVMVSGPHYAFSN